MYFEKKKIASGNKLYEYNFVHLVCFLLLLLMLKEVLLVESTHLLN